MATESCAGKKKEGEGVRRGGAAVWRQRRECGANLSLRKEKEGEGRRQGREGGREGGRKRGSQGGMSAPTGCMCPNTHSAFHCVSKCLDR